MNNIGNDVYMNTANNTIDSEISKLMKATVISNQCIIFAKVGAAIYVERKRIAYKPFVIDNNMMAFAPKDSCLEFVYYLFSSIHFSKYAQVGALPSYNASDIGAIKISMPSLAEQQKIAAYFTALDRSIAAAQKKAEALRIIKKGLLQKMFI